MEARSPDLLLRSSAMRACLPSSPLSCKPPPPPPAVPLPWVPRGRRGRVVAPAGSSATAEVRWLPAPSGTNADDSSDMIRCGSIWLLRPWLAMEMPASSELEEPGPQRSPAAAAPSRIACCTSAASACQAVRLPMLRGGELGLRSNDWRFARPELRCGELGLRSRDWRFAAPKLRIAWLRRPTSAATTKLATPLRPAPPSLADVVVRLRPNEAGSGRSWSRASSAVAAAAGEAGVAAAGAAAALGLSGRGVRREAGGALLLRVRGSTLQQARPRSQPSLGLTRPPSSAGARPSCGGPCIRDQRDE